MQTQDLTRLPLPEDTMICDLWMDTVIGASVSAALESGLFESLATEPMSAKRMGERLGKDPLALDAVLKALASVGLLSLDGDIYALSAVGRGYLVQDSVLYRGGHLGAKSDEKMHQRVMKMIESGWDPISQGNASYTEMWENGELSQEAADRFTPIMHAIIAGPAIAAARSGAFAGFKHVIDVAGGSGIFLSALKQHHPEIRVTLAELPQVCEAAKPFVQKFISLSQIDFVECNMFRDEWPGGGDAIYLSNILHDWPYAKGAELLAKAFAALPTGGSVFVNECLLDPGRLSPRHTVGFNLLMVLNHRSQQYTEAELFDAFRHAGFVDPRVVSQFGYYSVVRADKR